MKIIKSDKEILLKFIIILFLISSLLILPACKTDSVSKKTISATDTTEKVKETTTETTAITEVIDINPVEDEGILVPYIEGLKYDKDTNTYFALADNPYGLEVDTKAGVFIKEAIMVDDKIENGIGLIPEVIKVIQNFHTLKEKELRFPVPFDLVRVKGLIINLLESPKRDSYYGKTEEEYCWDTFNYLEIYAPESTIIYSPLKVQPTDQYNGCRILYSKESSNIDLSIILQSAEGLFYRGEGIHAGSLAISTKNTELIAVMSGYKNESGSEESYYYRVNTEIGMPLLKIKDNLLTAERYDPNIKIYYSIGQWEFNEEEQRYEGVKGLETGKDIFLEINGSKIFILPNDIFPSIEEIEKRNLEQIPVFEQKDIKEFGGLNIKGLDVVYRNAKWVYLDPIDNSMIGYWDNTEGQVIINSKVLKGEWEELFVGKTPEEIETYLAKVGEVEWNYENWSTGKIKLPLPLEISSSIIIENEAIFMFFKGLPKDVETQVYCPIPDVDSSIFPKDFNGENGGFALLKGDIKVDFDCSNRNDIITSKKETKNFKIGYPLLKIDGNDAFEEYELFKELESKIRGSQFFISLRMPVPDNAEPYSFYFTFNNVYSGAHWTLNLENNGHPFWF